MSGIWPAALGAGLVHGLWQGLVLCVAVEAVARAAGPSAPRLRHGVALAGLGLLLAGMVATVALVVTGAREALAAPTDPLSPAAVPSLGPAVLPALGWLWLAGAAHGIVRLAAGLVAVRRLVGGAEVVRDRALRRAFREARSRVGGPRRVALLASDELDCPVAVGWRSPAVVVPAGFARSLTDPQRLAILAHELEHVRRGDFRTGVLVRAVQALAGQHPAAWLLVRRLAESREELCDDATAARVDPLVYARALERLERGRRHGALRLAPAASATAARILRLLRPARFRSAPAAAALGLATLAVALAAGLATPRARAEGAALVRGLLPLVTIRAADPAGAFTLALRAGRAVGATVGGEPVPRERLVQAGDSIRILEADGQPHVTVRVARDGMGIAWSARQASR